MEKDFNPFNGFVKFYVSLSSKFWHFFVIFLFLFLNTFSAQEVSAQDQVSGIIVTTGDAIIYSKDPSFNQQISNSKGIQQHSQVIITGENELKVIAKNPELPIKKQNPQIKQEADLIANKTIKVDKKIDLPKRKIVLYISNKPTEDKFLAGYSSGNGSFVTPLNDYELSNDVIFYTDYSESSSLESLYVLNCFYKNDNFKLQVNISSFSVRPPPSDLI